VVLKFTFARLAVIKHAPGPLRCEDWVGALNIMLRALQAVAFDVGNGVITISDADVILAPDISFVRVKGSTVSLTEKFSVKSDRISLYEAVQQPEAIAQSDIGSWLT